MSLFNIPKESDTDLCRSCEKPIRFEKGFWGHVSEDDYKACTKLARPLSQKDNRDDPDWIKACLNPAERTFKSLSKRFPDSVISSEMRILQAEILQKDSRIAELESVNRYQETKIRTAYTQLADIMTDLGEPE